MTDWQPIETAPRDGTRILAFVPFGKGAYARKNHQIVELLWVFKGDRI